MNPLRNAGPIIHGPDEKGMWYATLGIWIYTNPYPTREGLVEHLRDLGWDSE